MRLKRMGLLTVFLVFTVSVLIFAGSMYPTLLAHTGDPQKNEEESQLIEKRAEGLAEKLKERFEGRAWQEQIRRIEEMASQIEDRFNGPEFQKKLRAIEEAGDRIEEHFQSEEWRQFELELATLGERISKRLQGAEWKAQFEGIEEITSAIEETFDEEWQRQLEQMHRELEALMKNLPKEIH